MMAQSPPPPSNRLMRCDLTCASVAPTVKEAFLFLERFCRQAGRSQAVLTVHVR